MIDAMNVTVYELTKMANSINSVIDNCMEMKKAINNIINDYYKLLEQDNENGKENVD